MAEAASGGITGLIGSSVGEAAAFAAGLAVGPLLEPLLQALRNETWTAYPDRPLDPEVAAELVIENALPEGTGAAEASLSGMSATRFDELIKTLRTAPGVAEARTLMRRSLITSDQLHHAYEKAKIEPQYWKALDAILNEPLPPAVAALAAVRGLIDAEGTLPVSPPADAGVIKPFPVYPISGKQAAAAAGYSEDAYAVMVGINGRPMSLHEAASAYFRGIIELSDYQRAVSEGDTRNEWRDAILEQARQILTAHDWVELHLRGWITQDEMYAGTANHGMSPENTDLLFKVLGRPITIKQITTGEARGGTYNGDFSQIPEAYLRSLQEGNIRPEWYSLDYANRYTLPSYFVFKAILASGGLTADEVAVYFTQEGWPPDLAKKAADALAPKATAKTVDPIVKSQRTAAVTAIRKLYENEARSRDLVTQDLQALGYGPDDIASILNIWDVILVASTAPAPGTVGPT